MHLNAHGHPPDLENLFGPPEPPDPDTAARLLDLAKREARLQESQREQILHWQAIFCTCPAYGRKRSPFTWTPGKPPGRDCEVHGHFMITPQGRVL